ncbi:DUF4238 domain-containing protein [Yersinia kristensenii]|nr:DUF4238 domain-containing protein [Yersinia kristensenii]
MTIVPFLWKLCSSMLNQPQRLAMSGKRQHFIPRFLQRGFEDTKKNGQSFVWVYRKGCNPFNPNIINVGTEGFFYSIEDDYSVDDEITAAETEFSSLIELLRKNGPDSIFDSNSIASLVAHFEIRTRHLRLNLLNTSSVFFKHLSTRIFDESFLNEYMKRFMKSKPNYVDDLINIEFDKLAVPNYIRNEIISSFKENYEFFLKNIISEFVPKLTSEFKCKIEDKLPEIVKKAQLDGLKINISPMEKISHYNKLNYSIINTDESLPLGDSIVIFNVTGEREFKPFCDKDDEIKGVYLPLGKNCLLYGIKDNELPNLSGISLRIAESSLEFIIGAEKSDYFSELSKHIGKNAYLLTDENIYKIIDEVINSDNIIK